MSKREKNADIYKNDHIYCQFYLSVLIANNDIPKPT